MSIDFDSGALQTQHEDEEYDKEDYAREQELQQLLTDLPHDLLEDSLPSSPEPNYSDCSDHDISQSNQHWDTEASWGLPNQQKNAYTTNHCNTEFVFKQGEPLRNQEGDKLSNGGWGALHSDNGQNVFDRYKYPTEDTDNEPSDQVYQNEDCYSVPGSEVYHLPEDFQPYDSGKQSEHIPAPKREHFQMFIASEGAGNKPPESVQVKYNPYQILNGTCKNVNTQDPPRRDGHFDDLQREFLDTGESSASNMQFVQLQVLYKARGRQLEELNEKLEESDRQIRYMSHQLAIVKDEKDGLAISLQESQSLLQSAKETEVQLKGQMAALEKNINVLTTNEEQLRKELKVANVAMESMQQQILDLRRSDTMQRTREQHEAVVTMLKNKNEDQVLALQQKLDDVTNALLEKRELCCRLEDQLKQTERKQEESKMEKTEIINRLTRSLEESQKQCANLLQTGSIQEANQLRLQLQQLQSSKFINDGMNKALQQEIGELKEQITMYESAAKLGISISRGEQENFSDSYVDLGIKKVNWQKSRFQRTMHNNDIPKAMSSEEMIMELKAELERCLNSNKAKRHQIVHLQSELREHQSKVEELKLLLEKSERTARDCMARTDTLESQLNPSSPYTQASSETVKEIQEMQSEKLLLEEEVKKHLSCIKELTASAEKLKAANQELCNEMRGMILEFDRDKKEAIERCERTYEQHHEDIKNKLHMELSEIYTAEKEQLCQSYEEKISQLQMQVNEMNQELTAVQECYIAVCKEKDSLEDTLGNDLKMKLQVQEEKIKHQYLEEKENALQTLKADLEDKHLSTLSEVKAFWQKEKETEMNKRVNVQVVLAKENWIKEQQQLTEKTIQEIENKWKDKLEQTLLNAKAKARQDLEDHAIQTEESQMSKTVFVAEQIDDLKFKLQKALEEKEQAVRKVQMELETRHHDSISKQVELAVTKARTRWLQELTSLSEYKANLKLEQEKWEKKSEQKIMDALSAAEENWRSKNDHADFNIKHKELEEKLASVKKELELKNEEYHALLKVELAKARAQWNKEKQEEMHHFQSQNEKDYCAFLDDHRNKISEALLIAKEDFEKQKKDLITHKDAEMKEQLDQHLKQWTSEESHRLLVREKEILAQLEQIMGEVPKELIDRSFVNDRSHVTSNFDGNFFEKLRALVQRSMKVTVYKILKNQKQEFKKKYEETQMNLKANTSECDSASNRDLLIKGTKVTCLEKNTHGKNGTTEYPCCEHCFQLLEKSRKECHELRNKLDKACRHLQQAVKEQKLKADKFRENESIAENLRKENSELQKKLEDTNAVINSPSNRTEEGCEKSCSLCKGNALEEMRTHYIKAVDKIKNDMLRYIHESKSRAAEMLKSEVLRERQETARKMRKYYLTCLQQLLKDDGKNEGAEKKIMNAASKLATMAKVLETPISQKKHSKNMRTAFSLCEDDITETKPETNDLLKTGINVISKRSSYENTDQQTTDEFNKHCVRDQSEGFKNLRSEVVNTAKQNAGTVSDQLQTGPDLRNGHAELINTGNSPFLNGVHSDKIYIPNCNDSNAVHLKLLDQGEPSFLRGIKGYSYHGKSKNTSDRQRFDLQETPVRDKSDTWIPVSFNGLIPQTTLGLNVKPQMSNTENFAAAGLCPHVEGSLDTFGSKFEGQSYSTHSTKRKDLNHGTQHSNKIIGLPPPAVKNCPDPKTYSNVSRGSKPPSRKLLLDFPSPQQDSGFDSPLPNFNSFK